MGRRGRRGITLTCLLTALAALAGLAGLAACDYPRDPEGTLDRVRGGVLRAGATESDPWVVLSGERPAGVEVQLVERLAAALGARVEWTEGSESDLMKALQLRELDVVVGGLDRKAPWDKEAALTQPYLTTRTVVAARTPTDPPADLRGVPVAVETGTEEAGLLEKRTGAVVVRVPDVGQAGEPYVVVPDHRLAALGLRETGIEELATTEHVVAVPLGENAWQVQVERFLLQRDPAELQRMAEEAAR